MRIIEPDKIIKAVARLCISANIHIGDDICEALHAAKANETSDLPRSVLDMLTKNAEIAKSENLPACQDTGMAVVFVSIGTKVHVGGNLTNAINEGVRRGYREGFFRNSVVLDPINRVNTGDNTPAVVHYDFVPGNQIKITVAPKGFGSENMGGIRMLNPSDGINGVEDFVIETVKNADANPCPPIIVGVGVGGTMEKAALISKQSLLREVGSEHPDLFWREVEWRLHSRINELNIGAAGFGGATTALAVHIATFPTHIAGLPVAVTVGCHATRHKTVII
ncbi:MAG: fumarate hydratase [Defluviitaleaceae bacterium]|nr:fumarate hydratase [Defluviitaleaceae bacterium]